MSDGMAFTRLLYRAYHHGEDTFFTLPGTSSARSYMRQYRGLRLHYATNMTVRPNDKDAKETGVSASLDVGLVLIPADHGSVLNHALLVTTALDWHVEGDDYCVGATFLIHDTALATTFSWQHPDNPGLEEDVNEHLGKIIALAKEIEPDMLCLINPDRSTTMPDDAFERLDRWTHAHTPSKNS